MPSWLWWICHVLLNVMMETAHTIVHFQLCLGGREQELDGWMQICTSCNHPRSTSHVPRRCQWAWANESHWMNRTALSACSKGVVVPTFRVLPSSEVCPCNLSPSPPSSYHIIYWVEWESPECLFQCSCCSCFSSPSAAFLLDFISCQFANFSCLVTVDVSLPKVTFCRLNTSKQCDLCVVFWRNPKPIQWTMRLLCSALKREDFCSSLWSALASNFSNFYIH